jgi:hypothetical protein
LIELVDSLRTNSDDGKFSLGIFIDLQKAFDTVDHEILLFKLSSYGIRGLALDWFRSYLTSRSQFVSACNARSSTLGLTCGVPQGSILGPLLFIIYINDIQSAVSKGTTKLFADDTNIFLTGKALDTVFVDANLVLNELNSWFSANKLSLSPEKTCYCLFSNHFIEIPTNLNLYLNGNPVPRVSNCKYLGVLLDSRLSWKYHIESVEHKLLKFVPIFYKLKYKLSLSILRMIYYAVVHPVLLYGIEVYANTYSTYLARIKIINNQIIRTALQADRRTAVGQLYFSFRSLPIDFLHSFQVLLFMHKFVYNNSQLPDIYNDYFLFNRGLWNDLPLILKQTNSFSKFKFKLWNYLMNGCA